MRFSNEIIPHRTDQMPRDRGTPGIIVQSPAIDWFCFTLEVGTQAIAYLEACLDNLPYGIEQSGTDIQMIGTVRALHKTHP